MIYFIETVGLPFVKMGSAGNVRKRLQQHQCGSPWPLRLLAVVSGNLQTEVRLRSVFAGHGVRGEWYRRSPSFDRIVDSLVLAHGDTDNFADIYCESRARHIRDRVARNREAADQIIATVMPLSSAGEAE